MIESNFDPEKTTLKEAKNFLRENYKQGCICPACNQVVKLYTRNLNSVMVRMLIQLHSLGDGFHHVSEIAKGISDTGTNDFSKLRMWLMIQEEINEETKKKNSGFWKITNAGKLFIEGKIKVPKSVFIFNAKKYGESAEEITIKEALGSKFNYEELMKS